MRIPNSHHRQESARGDSVEQETNGYLCKADKKGLLAFSEGYSFSSLSRIIIHLTQKIMKTVSKNIKLLRQKMGGGSVKLPSFLKYLLSICFPLTLQDSNQMIL